MRDALVVVLFIGSGVLLLVRGHRTARLFGAGLLALACVVAALPPTSLVFRVVYLVAALLGVLGLIRIWRQPPQQTGLAVHR